MTYFCAITLKQTHKRMKHFSITLMAVLCLMLSLPANADDHNKTKLTIRNESFTGIRTGEVYRDLSYYVAVELNHTGQYIEISHFGIGNAEIYLLDHQNKVVDNITIYEGTSIDYLDIPTQSGYYALVIWSNNYYGEAYFQVE